MIYIVLITLDNRLMNGLKKKMRNKWKVTCINTVGHIERWMDECLNGCY
jgi:hypothetical protein